MENHPGIDSPTEFNSVKAYYTRSDKTEAFFSVSPDCNRTFHFPYYGIEAISHVSHNTEDLNKSETLCVVLSGRHSVIIQGSGLFDVSEALTSHRLKFLGPGHTKNNYELVIGAVEVQIGDAGNR